MKKTATAALILLSAFAGAVGGYAFSHLDRDGTAPAPSVEDNFNTAAEKTVSQPFDAYMNDNNTAHYDVTMKYHTTGITYGDTDRTVTLTMLNEAKLALARKTTPEAIKDFVIVGKLTDQVNKDFADRGINITLDSIAAQGHVGLYLPTNPADCQKALKKYNIGDKAYQEQTCKAVQGGRQFSHLLF
ncbi:MAG: hypothetical protein GC185_00185 [Alphaproteobacteria bacterium]|nr:hypothetical protein [Alphaproteobacteria bacterium]